MAETRRLRQGYETVGMAMSHEDAMLLRVGATMARLSLGDYVATLLPRNPVGQVVSGPGAVRAARALEGVEASRKASSRPQDPFRGLREPGGGSMAWEDLKTTLEGLGEGSHKRLAEFLGLTNISTFGKTGIPAKHVPRIREFLAQSESEGQE